MYKRQVLNIDITVIRPEKSWENYWSLAKVKRTKFGNYTYLPTPKNRWCTEVLKLIPYDEWLIKHYPCLLYTSTYNPFVSYLNSLSNASAGNENATAEAQLTNEHFNKIAVDNPLTDFVYDKIMRERCNVILTGNAGDGKTTIAADIFERLSGERRPLNPQEFLAEQGIVLSLIHI